MFKSKSQWWRKSLNLFTKEYNFISGNANVSLRFIRFTIPSVSGFISLQKYSEMWQLCSLVFSNVNLLHESQRCDDGLLGSQLFHEVHDSWGPLPRRATWSESPCSIWALGLADYSHLESSPGSLLQIHGLQL